MISLPPTPHLSPFFPGPHLSAQTNGRGCRPPPPKPCRGFEGGKNACVKTQVGLLPPLTLIRLALKGYSAGLKGCPLPASHCAMFAETFASVCASENSNGCFQEKSKATSEPLAAARGRGGAGERGAAGRGTRLPPGSGGSRSPPFKQLPLNNAIWRHKKLLTRLNPDDTGRRNKTQKKKKKKSRKKKKIVAKVKREAP